jgi:acyl carrier protein
MTLGRRREDDTVTSRDKIHNFILSNFYVASGRQLTDEMSLLEEGIIDSTGVLELLSFVEQEFGVKAADDEILPENFDGVARIVAFVERKQGVRAAATF